MAEEKGEKKHKKPHENQKARHRGVCAWAGQLPGSDASLDSSTINATRKRAITMEQKKAMPPKKDKPKIEEPKDVLEEILKDHDEAREAFTKAEKSHAIADVKEVYAMLCGHHRAEEKHVFPDVKKVDEEAKELVAELITEHHESESGLKTMVDAKKFDQSKFMEIKAAVYDHMKEEESELFKKARKGLTQAQLVQKLEPFEKTEEAEKEKAG